MRIGVLFSLESNQPISYEIHYSCMYKEKEDAKETNNLTANVPRNNGKAQKKKIQRSNILSRLSV
jgi:hypothetical protein